MMTKRQAAACSLGRRDVSNAIESSSLNPGDGWHLLAAT
jgi:hypothetical protein